MQAKPILTFILFLWLLFPAAPAFPQKTEDDNTETEVLNPPSQETSVDKKDKKLKLIVLDEKFYISLGIDLAVVLLLMLFIYYPNYKKMECVFTFIIFNLIIFMLTFVLKYVKLSVGAAFGMFAVFGMLRYRTEGLSIRDLTYLFICIALGLISSIQLDYYKLAIINSIIAVAAIILDGNIFFKREYCKSIQYEYIEMIKPARREELMKDLRERTGLNIHRISVSRIDFLKDTAVVKVFYYEKA